MSIALWICHWTERISTICHRLGSDRQTSIRTGKLLVIAVRES